MISYCYASQSNKMIDSKPGGIIIPNIYLAAMLSERHQKYDIPSGLRTKMNPHHGRNHYCVPKPRLWYYLRGLGTVVEPTSCKYSYVCGKCFCEVTGSHVTRFAQLVQLNSAPNIYCVGRNCMFYTKVGIVCSTQR